MGSLGAMHPQCIRPQTHQCSQKCSGQCSTSTSRPALDGALLMPCCDLPCASAAKAELHLGLTPLWSPVHAVASCARPFYGLSRSPPNTHTSARFISGGWMKRQPRQVFGAACHLHRCFFLTRTPCLRQFSQQSARPFRPSSMHPNSVIRRLASLLLCTAAIGASPTRIETRDTSISYSEVGIK